MKQIEILGNKFFYEFICDEECMWITAFYDELKTKYRKKYWLFGSLIEVPDNRIVFYVYFDIETPNLTKSELKEILERKVELLDRKEQITGGELI